MPKVEQEISEIQKYFVTWIAEINLATRLDYFDINRISEGTCQQLLNLVFNYNLIDLNREQKNFPGIDLGDRQQGIAFQITSQKNPGKIVSSLKSFRAHNYNQDFPLGIRFFIINNGRKPAVNPEVLSLYTEIFNFKKDIYFPADIIELIIDLYYTDLARFNAIKQFLKKEFGDLSQRKSIVKLHSKNEKLEFYKRLFAANYEPSTMRFVPFTCKIGEEEFLTEQLPKQLFSGKGSIIVGPSGCGKSILSRRLALSFLNKGLPVLLQAKYYQSDLNALFEKEIKVYGFESGADFFNTVKHYQLRTLLIIDGFNECKTSHRPKLLLELELVARNYDTLTIITSQTISEELKALELDIVLVGYPKQDTKKAIAASYSGKKLSAKLDPILQVVSSSMEAKMIGEIESAEIDKVSRFTLFEIFIKNKLGNFYTDGFSLLSNIAKLLSDKITFSLAERALRNLISSTGISNETYEECRLLGFLENKLGKVSFAHEMFLNFFIADSVVRFAKDAGDIATAINAPKNKDKKLLIIGSIDDFEDLEKVLQGLTDVELLTAIHKGDGGSYCQLWANEQLRRVLVNIKQEILQLNFEFSDTSLHGIQFKPETLKNWVSQDLALIHTLPYILVKDQYITEFFELTGLMDDRCSIAVKELYQAAKENDIDARSATFSTAYIGVGHKEAAITRIFSSLASGFTTFRNEATISNDTVSRLLKDKSLKHGQFYFLLLLLRYNPKLKELFPYIKILLKNWRGIPYNLITEALNQIRFFYENDEQRNELIKAIDVIHSETKNIWLSGSLFDALGDLGALESDAIDYQATVLSELSQILQTPDNNQSWDRAAGIYYAQFDHPYDSAYYTVINQLKQPDKTLFLRMALQGYHSSFFTTTLIKNSWEHMHADIAPYLIRWTENPLIEPSIPQDSLTVFLMSYILLAKSNFSITSHLTEAFDQKNKSLFAGAEIYYWLNKADGDLYENKRQAEHAVQILFDTDNFYVIATIWQLQHCLYQSSIHQLFEESVILTIGEVFREEIVAAARFALEHLELQTGVYGFPRDNEEINLQAIYLLERHGSLIDMDVLRLLTEHPSYGEMAVRAIMKLSS